MKTTFLENRKNLEPNLNFQIRIIQINNIYNWIKNNFINQVLIKLLSASIIILLGVNCFGQTKTKKSLTILNIDVHGIDYTPEQVGNLLRLELEKLDTFEVTDRYDVSYLVKKNGIDVSNCYGKIGLVEVGKTLNSQKMLSGSVDLYGETLIITLRLVDVGNSVIEKSYVKEFLNLPKELQSILRVSLREMFGFPNEEKLMMQLTKPYTYETMVNTPEATRLNLSGPRMGATFFTGEYSEIIQAQKNAGGFDLIPVMYQIGYQFEIMYLNQGNFQALFEFLPIITGIDQSSIFPSITILNGIRHNLLGYEFAIGPNISLSRKAYGYWENGKWHLEKEWNSSDPNPYNVVNRADSRGDLKLSTSFVFAIGKTFKSGKMNFPVNVYCIPARDGMQMGISFGYNAKK